MVFAKRFQLLAIIILLHMFYQLTWANNEQFGLVVDKKAGCSIWVAKDATSAEKTAVKWLAEYLKRSSGINFKVQEFSKKSEIKFPAIILQAGKTSRDDDGFNWKVDKNGIHLYGNNPGSVIYGVCSFLEKYLGIRWLAPGELWTIVPTKKEIIIPFETYREKAGFPLRCIHISGITTRNGIKYAHWNFEYADWMARNYLNYKAEHVGRYKLIPLMDERGLKPFRGGHGLAGWMPNNTYYSNFPHYYAYNGFKRVKLHKASTQLNYSCPEMAQAFAGQVLKYLEKHPETRQVALSLNDGYGFSCDPIAKRDWFFNDAGTLCVSNSVFGFMNRVAEIVYLKHPDVILGQFAYTPYYHQPPEFNLHPNISINFTMYRKGLMTPIWEEANPENRRMHQELLQWNQKANPKQLVVREYISIYLKDGMFSAGTRMISEDLKWYRKMGFRGVNTEYPGTDGYILTAREMMYVLVKTLWNPNINCESVIDDFYAAAYGKAKKPMLEAYREYEKALKNTGDPCVQEKRMIAWNLLQTPGFEKKMENLLIKAINMADSQKAVLRIKQVKKELNLLLAMGKPMLKYKYLQNVPDLSSATLNDSNNAFDNPGFEEGDLKNWTFQNCTGEISDKDAWEGQKSLALNFNLPKKTATKTGATITVPVEKGEFYQIQVIAKPDKIALDILSFMYLVISGTDRKKNKVGPARYNKNWTPLYYGIHKAVSDKLTIKLWIVAGKGTWYFDGFCITKLKQRIKD